MLTILYQIVGKYVFAVGIEASKAMGQFKHKIKEMNHNNTQCDVGEIQFFLAKMIANRSQMVMLM